MTTSCGSARRTACAATSTQTTQRGSPVGTKTVAQDLYRGGLELMRGVGESRRPAVGTLAWTRQTQGIMNTRDRLEFLGQARNYGLATLPGRSAGCSASG